MFTGLVEAVGELVERKPTSGGFRLRIATPLAARAGAGRQPGGQRRLPDGDRRRARTRFTRTSGPRRCASRRSDRWRPAARVNLERPLRADSRFGGHFVQGHVDAIGHIEELRPEAEFHWLTVSFPPQLAPYIVHKGSIAVDGISLTVAGLGADRFDVMIVPFTMEHTNLRRAAVARPRQPRMRHGRQVRRRAPRNWPG